MPVAKQLNMIDLPNSTAASPGGMVTTGGTAEREREKQKVRVRERDVNSYTHD